MNHYYKSKVCKDNYLAVRSGAAYSLDSEVWERIPATKKLLDDARRGFIPTIKFLDDGRMVRL